MKAEIDRHALRPVLFVLTAISLAVTVALTAVLVLMALLGVYENSRQYTQRRVDNFITVSYCRLAFEHASFGMDDAETYFANTNFSFVITDGQGNRVEEVGNTYGEPDAVYEDFWYAYTEDPITGQVNENAYSISVYLPEKFLARDMYTYGDLAVSLAYKLLLPGPVLFCVSLVLFVLFCSLYLSCVGRGEEERTARRLPWDICAALFVLAVALEAALLISIGQEVQRAGIALVFSACFLVLDCLALTLLMGSLATRRKCGCLWRTSLTGLVLSWVWRGLSHALRLVPLMPRTMAITAAALAVELAFLCASWGEQDVLILGWAFSRAIILGILLYVLFALHRLYAGGRRLAESELDAQLATKGLVLAFRSHAEHLNSIGKSMSTAVEQRLRSERFKTELITNVSHDIKTPLTAIINYVDILSRTPPDDPAVEEYLDVLSRQSSRLKKLIEDLIEVSKASSGALEIEAEPVDVALVLRQALGEYRDRLSQAGLEVLEEIGTEPAVIYGDGRYLWRIFDNLFSNVLKYSLKGSRVYVSLRADRRLCVTFRNISREVIALSAEALSERFVRADTSRHSEGSGLGLNIAKSLAELMGGTLAISVDGDLFKAVLTFPLCEKASQPRL